MHFVTYMVAGMGVLTLAVGAIWLMTSRRNRTRLSQEDEETLDGLRKISKRTGTRWGMAASVDDDLNSQHGSSGSSDGGSGGDGES